MRKLGILLLVASGCSVEIEVPSIAFTPPAPGSTFTRDQLGPTGALVANVDVALDVQGDIARVAVVGGDVAFGDVDDAGVLVAPVPVMGTTTLTALAYDEAGAVLATAAVDVTIAAPEISGCHAWLDLYKLDYSSGPANLGIADPITVKLPLNGVAFRYSGNAEQRKTLYGDCTLMKSLAEAAPIVRAHDVKEIVDIGIYNYRCIDQTKTPPNCSMSQHSYAKAIDLAEFVTSDDTHYSVLKDFVIDTSGATCEAPTDNAKDGFLHTVICELKAADVWNIVLTPNYNADHRNHFHVDLTEGSDFIKRSLGGDDAGLFGD
jgi:hypothetical protein